MATKSTSSPLFVALLRAESLPEPTREYCFAAPRRWRFDLCWPDRLLACEIEGAMWTRGRHTRGEGYERDCEKYSEAAIRGWRVLRVTYGMIERGEATELVKRALVASREEVR